MKTRLIITAGLLMLLPALLVAGKQEKKHKVKSTITTMTVYENGKATTWKDSFEEFDRNGQSTLYIEYGKDESILHKVTTAYNKDGNVTEVVVTDATEGKSYRMTYTYTVMKDKTLLAEESEFTPNGSLVKKTVYTYNSSGKKATETVSDGTGLATKRVIYNYNAKNLKFHKQVFGKTNVPESSKEWLYEYY